MSSIEEVTVFTLGDSRKLSTWSNVPYFFTRTLGEKGIRVNRVDLSPGVAGRVVNRVMRSAARILSNGSTYDYSRSLVHFIAVRRRIKRAIADHPMADAHIFLTFSFSTAGLSDKPCLLFADWTYDHCFRHFLAREPGPWEKASRDREDRLIEAADLVFALFPSVAESMRQRYRNPNIFYAGNVVNSLLQVDAAHAVDRKLAAKRLLFVGSRKYIEGARQLISAQQQLRALHPELEVHIIGMQPRDLAPLPPGVFCHGYLDKAVEAQRDLYHELMLSARAIVNTTPKWGAFSAMLEGMHFYNPPVVTPYDEFVKTFGSTIDFGHYCPEGRVDLLYETLATLLKDDDYAARCQRAHDAVKQFSWSAYIDRLLAQIGRVQTMAHKPAATALST